MFEGGGGLLKSGAQVLVQGITGREASFWTEKMKEYGTAVVAGVTDRRERLVRASDGGEIGSFGGNARRRQGHGGAG
jgi:hypothetical protein